MLFRNKTIVIKLDTVILLPNITERNMFLFGGGRWEGSTFLSETEEGCRSPKLGELILLPKEMQ